jgi:hypothetical protein
MWKGGKFVPQFAPFGFFLLVFMLLLLALPFMGIYTIHFTKAEQVSEISSKMMELGGGMTENVRDQLSNEFNKRGFSPDNWSIGHTEGTVDYGNLTNFQIGGVYSFHLFDEPYSIPISISKTGISQVFGR